MVPRLTPAALQHLTSESLLAYFGHGSDFEIMMRPGCAAVNTGVPVADLNYIVTGAGAEDAESFVAVCEAFRAQDLPFLVLAFPGATAEIEASARSLGLEYAVDFPFMVREDPLIDAQGNETVVVRRAAGMEDAVASAKVLSAAFDIPDELLLQAVPASALDSPSIGTYLASVDEDVIGSVTLTFGGPVAGIWSMATVPDRQRSGIGRRLLSTAMADAAAQGVLIYYLGATPAGKRLYESLGFATRTVARVWVSGETHQS